MSKPCPGCGATTLPEARFCRLCGVPLKAGRFQENESTVSPQAQTAPLKTEGRSTDGLAADDHRLGASETSRVGRVEMEEILKRVEADYRKSNEAQLPQDGRETPPAETAALRAEETATTAQAASASSPSANPAASASQPPPANTGSRRLWTFAAVALLCVALVAGVLAFVLSRRAASTDAGAAQQPIAISDQKQLLEDKLAEAEPLLEAGEFNHAIEVLRAAVKIDPTSVEARMRLGNALERTGARGEAIEEYRAAAQVEPNNSSVLRALASAQTEEKNYGDAADSYRRLLAANPDAFDDETWLAYADAL
ncbi:MAG TPA: tetratricopeptide repeat protein, partial [Pyrinomonadaceae bacterium]